MSDTAGRGWKGLTDIKQYLDSKTVHEHLESIRKASSCHLSSLGKHFEALSEKAPTNPEAFIQGIKSLPDHAHFREIAYGSLFLVIAVIALTNYFIRSSRRKISRAASPTTPELEKGPAAAVRNKLKAPDRKPGEWTPSNFTTPIPTPYPDWSIEHTKPLPYRPFRYGPKYFVTMGLRSMDWDDWIELDNHFPRFHADKTRRIAERGSKCCHTAPEALPAALELLSEFRTYLPARYPTLYRATPTGIQNLWSGEDLHFPTPDSPSEPLLEDPMATASRLVQDDLAIMIEKPDGQYYLLAGGILLAGFWRLEDKLGMPLSEIHTSGDVPQFKQKLEKGMMNFFRRLRPEDPVNRNNYFIQVDDDLAWSHSIGSEDSPDISWNTAENDRAIKHHFFRSERQSLRRLPRSGGVVFTIRTYFHPITEIAQEDYVPGRLASAVRSWGDDVSRYKGKEKYGNVLLEYLDEMDRRQRVERGLVLDEEGREVEGESGRGAKEEKKGYPW